MFEWLFGKKIAPRRTAPTISRGAEYGTPEVMAASRQTMPTISFDSKFITGEVRADLESNLRLISDIPTSDFARVYHAALESVSRGGDLALLTQAILTIEGMTKKQAGDIARLLNNKATALINKQRSLRLGIKFAIWRYSNAPCGGPRQDEVHRRLDGKRYSVEKGMAIGKRRVWPGTEEGCKCGSSPVIPGFEE